jgi:hypothetical protein
LAANEEHDSNGRESIRDAIFYPPSEAMPRRLAVGEATVPSHAIATSPYYYPQYEFYSYPANAAEVGNQIEGIVNSTTGQTTLEGESNEYLGVFNSIVEAELYQIYPQFGPVAGGGNNAYANALSNYMTWLSASHLCPS